MTREQALEAVRDSIDHPAWVGPALVEALDRPGLLKLDEEEPPYRWPAQSRPPVRVLHVPLCSHANAGLSDVAVREDTLADVLRKAGYYVGPPK